MVPESGVALAAPTSRFERLMNESPRLCRGMVTVSVIYPRLEHYQNAENLTVDDKKKLACAFLVAPQLKRIYEHKEKFRLIFNQKLTREQGEIELTQWIEEAKKIKNKYLDKFLHMLNDWKAYVLNYFTHRFTTSIIEGINNSIKTVKRMGYGFRNFANFKERVLISFA